MMKIDDFSSLIELIATISAGFIAVEYVKSYTSILCEKIFQYVKFISESYDECRNLLTDRDTLDHIESIDVGGKSINDAVEKLKVKHESLQKEIREEEERQKKAMVEATRARSLSSTCFYVFLSCIVLLWGASFENKWASQVQAFLLIYCFCSLLYLILAWLLGEKEKSYTFLNFSSLRHSLVCFILILCLSIIFLLVFVFLPTSVLPTSVEAFIEPVSLSFIIIYIGLSYFNFAVFAWKINRQAKKFKETVTISKQAMQEKCNQVGTEVQDLLAVGRVNSKLSIEKQ